MGTDKIENFIFSSLLILLVLPIFILGNAEGETIVEIKKILASDAKEFDNFGFSIAVSGDTMVTGAPNAEGVEEASGAAYVFQKDFNEADNWGEVKKVIPSETGFASVFGFSVAISGDIIVVGNQNRETAFVFYRNLGGIDNWGEIKRINATSVQITDGFGIGVSIFGDTIVVGSDGDDIARGAAYIFQKDVGGVDNWGEVARIIGSDREVGDRFGESVGIYDNIIVVGGGQSLSPLANDPGFAYVFQRDFNASPNWTEIKKLDPSSISPGDSFGKAVSINEDIIVVGAHDEGSGTAYVFQKDIGGINNWGQVKELTASDEGFSDHFGWAVSISGDTILIGADDDDIAFDQSAGSAYVFEKDLNGVDNWGEVTKLIASDVEGFDGFGFSVGVSGDNFVIGSRGNDDNGNSSGSAYVFGKVPDPCILPQSEDWIITESCEISGDIIAPASIIIQNNSVVTINSGGSLTVPSGENIIVVDGSGLKLLQGSTLNVLT